MPVWQVFTPVHVCVGYVTNGAFIEQLFDGGEARMKAKLEAN
jgi:hypothetical protein